MKSMRNWKSNRQWSMFTKGGVSLRAIHIGRWAGKATCVICDSIISDSMPMVTAVPDASRSFCHSCIEMDDAAFALAYRLEVGR